MTKAIIKPVHPGDYLRELLDDLDISARRLAQHIDVSPMRVSLLLRGQRPVTAELALRLERAFGMTAQYWLNLQAQYDLAIAQTTLTQRVKDISPLAA